MMVQSPLKRQEVKPNLRRVPKPDITPSPSSAKKAREKKVGKVLTRKTGFPKIQPGKVILAAIIIGVFGFAYLTHVFATQKLLQEVQALEQEYNKARQMHDELKLRYDRMVGPAEIYQQAKEQGFINGGPADKIITVKE
ncbi:MAG: septum formation initiator family protein [Balneola sp.]